MKTTTEELETALEEIAAAINCLFIKEKDPKLLRFKEACRFLNSPEATVRRLVLEKKIPYCKVGGSLRFRVSELSKWIENVR